MTRLAAVQQEQSGCVLYTSGKDIISDAADAGTR